MSSATDTHSLNLAAAIHSRRVVLNQTQPEAAADLDVSLRTFQAWEAATTFPRPSHRRRIDGWIAGDEQQ